MRLAAQNPQLHKGEGKKKKATEREGVERGGEGEGKEEKWKNELLSAKSCVRANVFVTSH